jgi:hypothetical protein
VGAAAADRRLRSTLVVAERTPSGAGDDVGGDVPDADRLEEDWNRALDVASEAVSDSSRAHLLCPEEVSHRSESIRGQRKWLSGFGPALRKLFAQRKRPAE